MNGKVCDFVCMSEYRKYKNGAVPCTSVGRVFVASGTPSVAAQFISYRWGQMALRQDLCDSALGVDQQVMSVLHGVTAASGVSAAGASPVSVLQTKWQSSDLLMAAMGFCDGDSDCKQKTSMLIWNYGKAASARAS